MITVRNGEESLNILFCYIYVLVGGTCLPQSIFFHYVDTRDQVQRWWQEPLFC